MHAYAICMICVLESMAERRKERGERERTGNWIENWTAEHLYSLQLGVGMAFHVMIVSVACLDHACLTELSIMIGCFPSSTLGLSLINI